MEQLFKLYKLEEIIDKHLVADKQTHVQVQAIMQELIKAAQELPPTKD